MGDLRIDGRTEHYYALLIVTAALFRLKVTFPIPVVIVRKTCCNIKDYGFCTNTHTHTHTYTHIHTHTHTHTQTHTQHTHTHTTHTHTHNTHNTHHTHTHTIFSTY